jgi:hypothetical protein
MAVALESRTKTAAFLLDTEAHMFRAFGIGTESYEKIEEGIIAVFTPNFLPGIHHSSARK